jgi:O-antigen/teichoic acid export membrane protein
VVSLFLMPFIVHHLGDRLYGFWSLAAAFIGYYGLLDFALGSAVSQHLCVAIGRNDPSECRAVFNAALRVQLLLGGLALLATGILAVAAPWFCEDPADAALFWKVIVVLGVNAALNFPAKTYTGLLDATLRFDIQSWLNMLGTALRAALAVWALSSGGGLLALALVTLLASLPVMALQVWFARREAPWARVDSSPTEPQRAKSLFSYGAYTAVASIADVLRFQIAPLVISGFLGLGAVTHYRIASVLTRCYFDGLCSIISPCQPVLSRLHGAGDRDGLKKVFYFTTKVSLCLSVFLCLALIFWGRPFITRWMGPQYEDAYWPLVALAVGVLLDVGQSPSIFLLYATVNHRFYMYINMAEGLLNLTFSLALVSSLGIFGVALGTLIAAMLTRTVVLPLVVCRVSGLPFGSYMKFAGGNVLRCGSLMVAATAVVAWGLTPNYIALVGSAVCATVLYAVGSWFLVFDAREREQLLTAVTHRRRTSIEPEASAALV